MEVPNLSFIKEIAGEDVEFQNSILEIIKKEFPEEVNSFTENFALKNYKEATSNVHKIKHKISLLGLETGFEIASEFEKDLKKGNIALHKDFLEILTKIHVYLSV
jgi:HPt (histidine-containing phosphotransfer) domain-containing protein